MFTNVNDVCVIAASADSAARMVWAKKQAKLSKCSYDPSKGVVGTSEECALNTFSHTLEQYLDNFDAGKFAGRVNIVMPHGAHLRVCQIRKLLKSGMVPEDVVNAIVSSTKWEMSDETVQAITTAAQFVDCFLAEDKLEIQTYDVNEINYYVVTGAVSEGDTVILKDGQSSDGSVTCSNSYVSGTFEVYAAKTRKGTELRIRREANAATKHGRILKKVQDMVSKCYDMLPDVTDVDIDEAVEADELFA